MILSNKGRKFRLFNSINKVIYEHETFYGNQFTGEFQVYDDGLWYTIFVPLFQKNYANVNL